MIYISEIVVNTKTRWGDVYSDEFILPAKVKKIKAICVNVVPISDTSELSRITYQNKSGKDVNGEYISTQIGAISASLNNTQILVDSIPLCVTSLLKHTNWSANKITLHEPIEVQDGSIIRLIVEEKLNCPFASVKKYDLDNKEYEERDTGYKVKFYIEYDK